MATDPHDYLKFPNPSAEAAGRNHLEKATNPITKVAQLYRPPNANLDEAPAATLARFSQRLVDSNGVGFTADEIAANTENVTAAIADTTLTPEALVVPSWDAVPNYIPATNEVGTVDGVLRLGGDSVVRGTPVVGRRIKGSTHLVFDGPNTGQTKVIASFPISADECAFSTLNRLTMSGTIDILVGSGSANFSNLFIGLAFEDQKASLHDATPPLGWSSNKIHPNPGTNTDVKTLRILSFVNAIIGAQDPGTVDLDWDGSDMRTWIHTYADGNDPVTTIPTDFERPFYALTSSDEAQNIYLVLELRGATGGSLSKTIDVIYDLDIAIIPE